MIHTRLVFLFSAAFVLILAACAPRAAAPTAPTPPLPPTTAPQNLLAASTGTPVPQAPLKVVAVETFLADIAQNIAGDRVQVEAIMPIGLDPHAFEPTPQDVRKIAESDVLIINGAGFEEFLDKLLANAGGQRRVIAASKDLVSRQPRQGELIAAHGGAATEQQGDPHFWLDPLSVVKYAENIRDGLTQADPAGAAIYKRNAEAYIAQLKALDARIKSQVERIPAASRKLVTDHDTLGYFADRYGFQIVGVLIPSFSTADSSSAQQLAALIEQIKATNAPAIFLEQSMKPRLAEQVARETGARVVTGFYTHSLSEPNGPAPTYIQMMEFNVARMVDALK